MRDAIVGDPTVHGRNAVEIFICIMRLQRNARSSYMLKWRSLRFHFTLPSSNWLHFQDCCNTDICCRYVHLPMDAVVTLTYGDFKASIFIVMSNFILHVAVVVERELHGVPQHLPAEKNFVLYFCLPLYCGSVSLIDRISGTSQFSIGHYYIRVYSYKYPI